MTHKQCTDTYRDHPPSCHSLVPHYISSPLFVKDRSSVLPVYSSSLLQLELVVYAPAAIKETYPAKDKLGYGKDGSRYLQISWHKTEKLCQPLVPPAGHLVSSSSSVHTVGD